MLSQQQINNLITGTEMAAELPASGEGLRRFLEIHACERGDDGKLHAPSKFVKRSKHETVLFGIQVYEISQEYIDREWYIESEQELTFYRDLGYVQGITALEAVLKEYLQDLSLLVPGYKLDLPYLEL